MSGLRRAVAFGGPYALAWVVLALQAVTWAGPPALAASALLLAPALRAARAEAAGRPRTAAYRVFWLAAGAAAALAVWSLLRHAAPTFVAAAAAGAPVVGGLVARGRGAAALTLVLALAAVPVVASRAPLVWLGYAAGAAPAAWALAARRAGEWRPTVAALAAFLWWLGAAGGSFYLGSSFHRGEALLAAAAPTLRPAFDDPTAHHLVHGYFRWAAESCGGTYRLAASQGDLYLGERSTRALAPRPIELDGAVLGPQYVDTFLADCARQRLVLVHDTPAAVIELIGEWPPTVRVVRPQVDGTLRRGWLDPRGGLWLYVTGGAGGRERLERVDDDGRALERVVLEDRFRCRITVSEGASRSTLVFDDQSVRVLPRVGAVTDESLPVLLDPYGSTCALVPETRALVFSGFLRPGLDVVTLDRLAPAERVLAGGIRNVYHVPAARALLAVDYFSGRVTALDDATFEPLATLEIGRRARRLTFSADGTRAFALSSAGAFEIDLAFVRAAAGSGAG